MSIDKLKNRQIAEEAAHWAVKLDARPLSKHDKKALAEWFSESSLHVDELLLTTAIMTGMGEVDKEKNISIDALLIEMAPDVVPLFKEGRNSKTQAKKTPVISKYFARIAATLLLSIITLMYIFTSSPQLQYKLAFVTKVGEQRSFTLEDGSIIHVNTKSNIRIKYQEDERLVELLSGEAMFEVAHDTTRPFRVYSGDTMTQAVGTIFNVRYISGLTKVAVFEGRVAVQSNFEQETLDTPGNTIEVAMQNNKKLFLNAGEQASVTQNGHVLAENNPNMLAVKSWRIRKLIFKSDTLSAIAVEFNRYNNEHIYVDDKSIADFRFSGVFNADDPHSFIKYLEAFNNIHIDTSVRNEFHLSSPSSINNSESLSVMNYNIP